MVFSAPVPPNGVLFFNKDNDAANSNTRLELNDNLVGLYCVKGAETNGLFLINNATEGDVTLLKHNSGHYLIFEDDRFSLKFNGLAFLDYNQTANQLSIVKNSNVELIFTNTAAVLKSNNTNRFSLTEDLITIKHGAIIDIIAPTVRVNGAAIVTSGFIGQTGIQGSTGLIGSTGLQGATGFAGTTFQMVLAGNLDSVDPASLPISGIGSEIAVVGPKTLTIFYAERMTEGSSGTTIIQLEVNESPVAGGLLSWNPGDLQTTKSVSVNQLVMAGDMVSFRLIAKETGAADIIAGVT